MILRLKHGESSISSMRQPAPLFKSLVSISTMCQMVILMLLISIATMRQPAILLAIGLHWSPLALCPFQQHFLDHSLLLVLCISYRHFSRYWSPLAPCASQQHFLIILPYQRHAPASNKQPASQQPASKKTAQGQ